MITVQSVSKVFPGKNGHRPVAALDGVSLDIADGELVTVIGPSGSGKSTLLFTLGAMMKPTTGDVLFGETSVYTQSARRRAKLRQNDVGFVFQTFNLFSYLSCRDNVAVPAILAGVPRAEARQNATSMLERLGLRDRLGHRPSELSVGERQRVALCRSLANGPDLLLADEPTGNLDPEMTDTVMDLLLELNAKGQTIVVVTHDQALAERGTRVVNLRDGKIAEDRRVRDVGVAL